MTAMTSGEAVGRRGRARDGGEGQRRLRRLGQRARRRHGEAAVAAVLRLCMANGWAGIAWDKVAGEPAAKAREEQEDVSWMKAYL